MPRPRRLNDSADVISRVSAYLIAAGSGPAPEKKERAA